MTFYMFFADRHGTSTGVRWQTMGLVVKTAQSVSPITCCVSAPHNLMGLSSQMGLRKSLQDLLAEEEDIEHLFHELLDRDLKVNHHETQRRRELFWELFTYDSWQCFTLGRPPSFARAHFDTKMPFLDDKSDENSCELLLVQPLH